MLSSRAVLQGFGVGDSASSATAAVLLTVLQEATGRLATILFAHRYGRAIEPECKFYRFLADIVNDSALFLDILSPALPQYPKILALCGAGILRALCGVSGGAAKASLSAHFAKTGNLAELNAKDGSQETVISLLGMLVGSLFVQLVHSKKAVWAWMVVLVGVHLWTNYQAVRSVEMRTLNRQRLTILAQYYFSSNIILRPKAVAAKESILRSGPAVPDVSYASKLSQLRMIQPADRVKFRSERYIIVKNGSGAQTIFLKERATPQDIQKAWVEACVGIGPQSAFLLGLKTAGWDVEANALVTGRTLLIKEAKQGLHVEGLSTANDKKGN